MTKLVHLIALLLVSFEAFSCEKVAHLDSVVAEIKRSEQGVSEYEILISKKMDERDLLRVDLVATELSRVVFNIATNFHDASTYESDIVYQTHMKSRVVLADEIVGLVEVVAVYDQVSEGGVMLMCSPEIRIPLRTLIERYNKRLQPTGG